jgi:hypothetical protein
MTYYNYSLIFVVIIGFILYFLKIVIQAEIEKSRIRNWEKAEEIRKNKEWIAECQRREYERKLKEEREEEDRRRKQLFAEIQRREHEKKQKEVEIKKEIQRKEDFETQNNVYNFPDSFIIKESYYIDYYSSEVKIVLKNSNSQIPLSRERFFNLYVYILECEEVIKNIVFVDEFRRSECCRTIRNILDTDPNFKFDQRFRLTVTKTLHIRNEFVNRPDVSLYKRNRYSMYRQYVMDTRKLSRPAEGYLSVLKEKYGQSTPTNEIIKLEWKKLYKMLYSSELIAGTTDEHLHFIPVFVLTY